MRTLTSGYTVRVVLCTDYCLDNWMPWVPVQVKMCLQFQVDLKTH